MLKEQINWWGNWDYGASSTTNKFLQLSQTFSLRLDSLRDWPT